MNERRSVWERLQQRWAVGDRLSESEQRERLEGAQEPAARDELYFYQRARSWLGETTPEEAEENARFVAQALNQTAHVRSPSLRLVEEVRAAPGANSRRAARPKARVWVLAGVAAAAVGVWLQTSLRPRLPATSSSLPAHSAVRSARCELSSVSGVVEARGGHAASVVGALLQEGDTLATRTGTACLMIERTVRVCLPADSRLALTSLRPEDIRVHVEQGASLASLSPRPPGSFFSLTGHGVVATAHGTIFALELSGAGAAAEVTVFEGSVEVSSASERLLVAAGDQARFDDAGQRLPPVAVDDEMRGRWPGWLPTPPPANAALPASAQPLPTETPPEGNVTPPSVTLGSTERVESGLGRDALFAAARKQAGLGNARAARTLYRALVTRYPGPGTASVQVVLGNLEMDLGAPERALAAFEAYLRSPGPLELEALHGKVRALRALGRRAEEKATIRSYLARYPNSIQGPTLKRRLSELE